MELGAMLSNLFVSACWACGITFVVILFRDGLYVTLNHSRLLREARDAGHELVAMRVDVKYERGQHRNLIWGFYEYEYRSKIYKYKNRFHNYPPKEITLYFIEEPAKAKPEQSFGGSEAGYVPLFIVVMIIIFFLKLWLM